MVNKSVTPAALRLSGSNGGGRQECTPGYGATNLWICIPLYYNIILDHGLIKKLSCFSIKYNILGTIMSFLCLMLYVDSREYVV